MDLLDQPQAAPLSPGPSKFRLLSRFPRSSSLAYLSLIVQGSRGDTLIEKATELGVSAIFPILTQRSVFVPSADDSKSAQMILRVSHRHEWLIALVFTDCHSFLLVAVRSHLDRFDRWQRLVIEASKQSLTPLPPVLHHPKHFAQLLEDECPKHDVVRF